MESGAENPG